jgi:hypothetical protein
LILSLEPKVPNKLALQIPSMLTGSQNILLSPSPHARCLRSRRYPANFDLSLRKIQKTTHPIGCFQFVRNSIPLNGDCQEENTTQSNIFAQKLRYFVTKIRHFCSQFVCFEADSSPIKVDFWLQLRFARPERANS